MTTVVIVIHLMVVLAMIGLILLQRSEGGALGIGGGQNAFLTGRSAGNVLSHTTAYLAIAFFLTSLGLALIAKYQPRASDIIQRAPGQTEDAAPAAETPAPAPVDAPTSAEEMLQQLGGSSGGTQTPPAADSETPPAGETGTPAPASQAPTPAPAPSASGSAPAVQPAPAPQTPPATTP
jgi:preprotein translocase subunit SecG